MQSWRIGDVKVTKIVELEATGGTRFILPQATREAALQIPWLAPHFMDDEGRLKMSIHALVIEAPGRRMIVDTCLGNDKQGAACQGGTISPGRSCEILQPRGLRGSPSIP